VNSPPFKISQMISPKRQSGINHDDSEREWMNVARNDLLASFLGERSVLRMVRQTNGSAEAACSQRDAPHQIAGDANPLSLSWNAEVLA
jgi:hypothetical protein